MIKIILDEKLIASQGSCGYTELKQQIIDTLYYLYEARSDAFQNYVYNINFDDMTYHGKMQGHTNIGNVIIQFWGIQEDDFKRYIKVGMNI